MELEDVDDNEVLEISFKFFEKAPIVFKPRKDN